MDIGTVVSRLEDRCINERFGCDLPGIPFGSDVNLLFLSSQK
jgi:hypothetical protein